MLNQNRIISLKIGNVILDNNPMILSAIFLNLGELPLTIQKHYDTTKPQKFY